jgi:arylsulfatase A
VDQPGSDIIHIWQGCGKGSGGSEIEIICAGQTNPFMVDDTGHFQNFRERKVGTITFVKPGPQSFELRAKVKPGMAVMDCRQIILVPVK